jgi:WD40 repeat protein
VKHIAWTKVVYVVAAVCMNWPLPLRAEDKPQPMAIAEVKRDAAVNFEKEVLPILAKNCVACHNTKKSENSLVLENPAAILKGGDQGPAVVAGKSAESLLLKVAAHQEEPLMPPADNSVGALVLTGEQLGLIKLWIDQGATGSVTGSATPIQWQSLPSLVNPVYAVTLSGDARYAACGRANQIFVYNVASGRLTARLTDPTLSSGLYSATGAAHLDLVQSLAFSPDGERLASGSFREAKLWRRPHDVHRADLPAAAAVQALAVSPDNHWAALGLVNGAIQLWDLRTAKDPKTLGGHSAAVTAVRFLPDGARLVSVSLDKTIRLWNAADGSPVGQLETPAPIQALAVVVDGSQVVTGGADNAIRLFSVTADPAAPLVVGAQLPSHAQPVTALAASPSDKTQLISGAADGSIRQWNLANNQQVREINHGGPVTALAIRGDGQQWASAGADNLIKLWNAADGQPWAAPDKQPIVAMRGDFRTQFVAAQMERALAAINAKVADDKKGVTDAETKIITTAAAVTSSTTAKETAAKTLAEKNAAVKAPTDAKAAADKELADATAAAKAATEKSATAKAEAEKDAANAELAKAAMAAKTAADDADKKAKEAEKKSQEATAALTKAQQEASTADAANMAAEQAATAAVTAIKKAVTDVPLAEQALKKSQDILAQVQARTDADKQAAAEADKPVRTLAYSADGSQLLSAGDNHLVRTWTTDNGAAIETFAGHKAPVTAAAFAADGTILSAGADTTAIVWDTTPAWTLERTIGSVDNPALLADRVTALAFSPDGAMLATGGGEPSHSGELKIWSVADGNLARAMPDAHSDTIFGLEFSPDGMHLASSAADRFVKVFNAASGAHVKSFEGHTHHVLDVTWKWDGKVLASCGADNVVKVWDFITGDQLRTIAGFTKEVTSVGFVGASPKLFACSGDKTVRLLDSENGRVDRNFAGGNDFMYTAATSADGKVGVAAGQESTVFVWLIDNAQLLKSFAAPKAEEQRPASAQTAGR